MSHFYSSIKGGRGEATRCGHKTTGIRAIVKTWHAEIETYLTHRDGVDWANVFLRNEKGQTIVLYDGPLNAEREFVTQFQQTYTLKQIEDSKEYIESHK